MCLVHTSGCIGALVLFKTSLQHSSYPNAVVKSFLVTFRHSLSRGIQYWSILVLTDISRSANIYVQLNVCQIWIILFDHQSLTSIWFSFLKLLVHCRDVRGKAFFQRGGVGRGLKSAGRSSDPWNLWLINSKSQFKQIILQSQLRRLWSMKFMIY